jgi:hypothetical protein
MNRTESKTESKRVPRLVDGDYLVAEFVSDCPAANSPEEAALAEPVQTALQRLRSGRAVDAQESKLLESALQEEHDLDRVWLLLSALQMSPPTTISTQTIYSALCRLTEADSPVIRHLAYRGLAGLHRIDLRFENRARLKLGESLKREQGIMHERVKQLLTRC